jgi:ubiquitin-protein ligase
MGNIKLEPNESNIFSWKAVIPGPAGSPYEGGEFEVDIRVPDDYPYASSRSYIVKKH